MRDDRQASEADDLVYMVTGQDENGDTLNFVTSDLRRAEARHEAALRQFKNVRANWLDDWAGRQRFDTMS